LNEVLGQAGTVAKTANINYIDQFDLVHQTDQQQHDETASKHMTVVFGVN